MEAFWHHTLRWRRRVRWVVLVALAATAALPARAGPDRDVPPMAIDAELTGDGSRTVLTVTLTGAVAVSGFVLDKPDRAVVEIGTGKIALGREFRRTAMVSAVRFGAIDAKRSRIVLDLAGPATLSRTDLVPGAVPGTVLLVAELDRTNRAAFRGATAGMLADPATTGSLGKAAAPLRRHVVAIDAGHGGSDSGALSAIGAQEKDLTLAFARSLRDALPAYDIVLTRSDDTFVPLDDRVARARAGGAELFVSIHADTISRPNIAGATIYTGAERASDGESARLAERENRADRTGDAPARPPGDVLDILGELTARETRGFSHRFAGLLLAQLGPAIRLNAVPHREAGFRVLRAADIPSVLVELGYLSNSRDAQLMSTEAWRQRTTDAMARAIDRFFAANGDARAAVSP